MAASLSGPLCVLAGAGTGKTRAITHRIAYGVLSGVFTPQRVLAVTFTARAAGEMRSRLRDLGVAGVQARTFHAAALRQLHYFWPQAIGGAAPEVLPQQGRPGRRGRVPAAAADRPGRGARPRRRGRVGQGQPADPGDLRRGRAPGRSRPGRPGPDDGRPAARGATSRPRTSAGVIDFEDVLLVTAGVLQENPADRRRPVREQYRHFVVDEYQDVNPLQQRLLDLWLGGRDELCVVGDAAQTIYSFTGASPEHLLGFGRRFPGAPGGQAGPRLPLDPAGRRTWPTALLARAGGLARSARLELHRPAAARPGPAVHGVRRRRRRGRAASPRRRPSWSRTACGRARSPCCSAPTPSPSRSSRRWPRPACPTSCAAASGSSPAGRCATPSCCCAARPGPPIPTTPLGEATRDALSAAGWTAEPPSGTGAVRERWESLQALAALADELAAARPGATLSRPGRRAGRAGGGPARPDRRGRDPGLAARGQGPGVGRRVPGRADRGAAADHASPRA